MVNFTTSRLHQEIAISIANDIRDGVYKIGDRLPNERKLSEIKKVSRSVIREAFLVLKMLGIIEIKIGSGVYVIQNSYDLMSMLNTLDMGPSPSDVIDTRIMLEGEMASYAAKFATNQAKQNIQKAFDYCNIDSKNNFLKTDDINQDADYLFHIAIAESTKNTLNTHLLTFLWKTLRMPLISYLEKLVNIDVYSNESITDHEKILQAILLGNSHDARNYMHEHLNRYKTYLLANEGE